MGLLDRVVANLSKKAGIPMQAGGGSGGHDDDRADTGGHGDDGHDMGDRLDGVSGGHGADDSENVGSVAGNSGHGDGHDTDGHDGVTATGTSAAPRRNSFPAVCYMHCVDGDFERVVFENAQQMREALGVVGDARGRINTIHTRRGFSVYASAESDAEIEGHATDYYGQWREWRGDYIVARFYQGVLQDMSDELLREFVESVLDCDDIVTHVIIDSKRERAALYGADDDSHVCDVSDWGAQGETDSGAGYSFNTDEAVLGDMTVDDAGDFGTIADSETGVLQ